MTLHRPHPTAPRRLPRLGLVVFTGGVWLALGLISQAAFQLVG